METIPHLSKKEREAIKARDGYTSGMRHYSEEKGWYQDNACPFDGKQCNSLHVHHIEPVRYLVSLLFSTNQINDSSNLITLFSCQHIGVCPEWRIPESYARKKI